MVLEPGGGAGATTMAWIAPAVARDTRVCVYDRAGRGWSDAAQTPPDAVQISTDLHTLLARAHVPGPYVLAGHSFGGLYVMTYADRYPDEVAGLVLVDSTAPKSGDVPDQRHGYSVLKHLSSLVSTTARLGLGRAIAATGFAGLPPESRDEARSHAASAEEMSSFLDEFGVASRSEKEAGRLGSLDGLGGPALTVPRSREAWLSAQAERTRHELAAAGYPVLGDLDRLVPGPLPADPVVPVDAEVLALAVGLLLDPVAATTQEERTR